MPIISFSKKVLDEYVTSISNSNELLEPQIRSLELQKSSKDETLDVESYTEN